MFLFYVTFNIGKVKADEEFYFKGAFNDYTVNAMIKELNEANAKTNIRKSFVIRFSSGGGSVFAGHKLIETIMAMQKQGRRFIGIVEDFCASMCFTTLQYMDKRYAKPLATLMQHNVSGGGNDQDAMDMKDHLEWLHVKQTSKRSKLPARVLRKLFDRNYFGDAELSLKMGFIDEIIQAEVTEPPKIGQRNKE